MHKLCGVLLLLFISFNLVVASFHPHVFLLLKIFLLNIQVGFVILGSNFHLFFVIYYDECEQYALGSTR